MEASVTDRAASVAWRDCGFSRRVRSGLCRDLRRTARGHKPIRRRPVALKKPPASQAAFLMVPEHIAKLIPPRPAGYDFTRELFKKKTGLAFDVLAPAEASADLTFSFLFNPERVNRLAINGSLSSLGLTEMVNRVVNDTWKAPRKTGIEGLIQLQTEQVLLTYLLSNSVDEQVSFAARGMMQKSLADLKTYLEAKKKTSTDATYTGSIILALERMKSPDKAKPTIHAAIPPGAPIGQCEESD